MYAVGMDGEEQLSNHFPEATRLLCSLHKRDNIKTKLRELRVRETGSKEIMNSILAIKMKILSTTLSKERDSQVRE